MKQNTTLRPFSPISGRSKNAPWPQILALSLALALQLPAVATELLSPGHAVVPSPSEMVATPPLAVTSSPPASGAKLEDSVGKLQQTVQQSTQQSVQQTMVPASTLETISSEVGNFQVVSNGLWRGALPSHKAIAQLAKSGVKTIVDLRYTSGSQQKEAEVAKQYGVNYVNIPLGFEHPSLGAVAKFLAIVSKPANQPVFVHCRQGADRTGTLVGVFRILHDHWSFKEAYQEMRTHHFKPFLAGMKSFVARCETEPQLSKELAEMADKMQQQPAVEGVARVSVKTLPNNI